VVLGKFLVGQKEQRSPQTLVSSMYIR
jgi:hypothetical protein